MEEWFTTWFNSKYYHILYQNRDDKEAEHFLERLSKLPYFNQNSNIIDIACGKGRHSLFLNRLGYRVTGVDLSENSIQYAKKFENQHLQFDVSDMRKCYKKNTFDIALNLFTSFGYFEKEEDNLLAIKAMSESLKEDGVLILDFLNSKKVITNLKTEENKTLSGIQFNITKKLKNTFIYKSIRFSDKGENYQFTEKVKALSLSDFLNLLNFAGMKLISTFGNYNLDSFEKESSDRLIIIAKK